MWAKSHVDSAAFDAKEKREKWLCSFFYNPETAPPSGHLGRLGGVNPYNRDMVLQKKAEHNTDRTWK